MRLLASVVALLWLAACAKPTDAVIPSEVEKWDTELAPHVKALPEADRELLASFLLRAKLGEASEGKAAAMFGITVGPALAEQKKFEAAKKVQQAEEEQLRTKLAAERDRALAELNQAVTVTLVSKRNREADSDAGRYRPEQSFRIGVQNKATKALAGVEGTLLFIDIFENEVGSVSFAITEAVEPGPSTTWNGSRDYNQFIDEHKAVWNLAEGKYKTRFVPETIVFADGTKLAVPD